MKIPGRSTTIQLDSYVQKINQIHRKETTEKHNEGQLPGGDRVNLSSHAKEAQQAFKTLKAMPEIRQDKVSDVKTQMETGSYQVDSEKTSEELLRETFENNSVMSKLDIMA